MASPASTRVPRRHAPVPAPQSQDAHRGEEREARKLRRRRLVLLAVVVCGLGLRLWILGRSSVSSDEAVVGLMAREILSGHVFAFYWGQLYGGGEPYVVAALFALFGESRLVLGLAPVLLHAVAAVLVWRLGHRIFDQTTGVLAALLFWIWPEDYLYLSTVEYGFRYLALVCGLVVLLFALRLSDPPRPRVLDAVVFGGAAGVGWWCSPEIVYFVLPALLVLAWRPDLRRRVFRRPFWPAAAGAGLLGASPWLMANVQRGFGSLHGAGALTPASWAQHVEVFAGHVLPLVLGLTLRGSGAWVVTPWAAVPLYVAALVVLAAWLVLLAAARQALLLVVFVVLFPLLYAVPATSAFWTDGRYALYLAPVLALLVAGGLRFVSWSRLRALRVAPAVGLAAALVLTGVAAASLGPYRPLPHADGPRSSWLAWSPDPGVWQRQIVAALDAGHERAAYASYWAAYSLMFEARGRIVVADPFDSRYQPYLAAVRRDPHPAWLFPRPATLRRLQAVAGYHTWLVEPGVTQAVLEQYLRAQGIPFTTRPAGFFTVLQPARRVDPATVAKALSARAAGRRRGVAAREYLATGQYMK